MPHKHKRLKVGDNSQFNLPPSAPAKALPVKHSRPSTEDEKKRSSKKKGKSRDFDDDTPRAFAQLMRLRDTGKGFKGLDDGRPPPVTSKKRKRNVESAQEGGTGDGEAAEAPEVLKIQPGERLTDYNARVDQSLPVAGLIAKNSKNDQQRKTKHNKKLLRLVNNWKAEEAKRLEKNEGKVDEMEEEEDENDAIWQAQKIGGDRKGKKRRGSDAEEELKKRKREKEKPKIYDVVQAPPQFTKVPKEFKVRDGVKIGVSNVPNNPVSVHRQEVLAETRKDVIARYREMMAVKRGEI